MVDPLIYRVPSSRRSKLTHLEEVELDQLRGIERFARNRVWLISALPEVCGLLVVSLTRFELAHVGHDVHQVKDVCSWRFVLLRFGNDGHGVLELREGQGAAIATALSARILTESMGDRERDVEPWPHVQW
jgi:hypothetical protein